MANPITWRNLNSQPANVTGLMYGAQQSASNAFKSFNNVINQETQRLAGNHENQIDSNTQAFMDQLSQYRSPEELAQAQEAGVFDQMRDQFGGMVDRNATRDAPAARMNELRGRETDAHTYEQTLRSREEQPIMEAGRRAIATGDTKGFQEIVQNNPNISGLPDLMREARDHKFTTRQQNRQLEQMDRDDRQQAISDDITETVNTTLNDLNAEQAMRSQAVQDIMQDFGVLDATGRIPEDVDEEQLKRARATLREAGLDGQGSSTAAAREAVAQIRARNPDASQEQIERVRDDIFMATARRQGFSPEDMQMIEGQRERKARALGNDNNPYILEEGYEPNAAFNDVMQHAEKVLGRDWKNNYRRALSKILPGVLDPNGGVRINDAEGSTAGAETIPMTPEMLKTALTGLKDRPWVGRLGDANRMKDIRKHLLEFVDTPQVRRNMENKKEWEEFQNNLLASAEGALGGNAPNASALIGGLSARIDRAEQERAAARNAKKIEEENETNQRSREWGDLGGPGFSPRVPGENTDNTMRGFTRKLLGKED